MVSVNETGLVHIWYSCHGCDMRPIKGKRHECLTCPAGPENDLCDSCFQKYNAGQLNHPAEGSYLATAAPKGPHQFRTHEGQPAGQFSQWREVPHPNTGGPNVPDHFVIRPEFCSGYESAFGGYGFAAEIPGMGTGVFTALHVMDEMIKKKGIETGPEAVNYTGKELPAVITKVNLYDVMADNWMLTSLGNTGPMLVLPNARTGDEEPDSHRDIAVFSAAGNSQLKPAKLAETTPAVGEAVWLAVKLPEAGNRTLKAVTVEVTDHSFVFKYDGKAEGPKYSSGAPILNAKGEVVGINVGGGYLDDAKLGHANHVNSIRRHLSESALP